LNDENTKEKKNFVLSNFRVFVINLFFGSGLNKAKSVDKGQKGGRSLLLKEAASNSI